MEEFLAYMKTDVQQRMVDHMLETSKLMNGNDSVILISSDSEEEEKGQKEGGRLLPDRTARSGNVNFKLAKDFLL